MSGDVTGLRKAEDARNAALIAADRDGLDTLLAPGYEHVHGSGRVEGRESFLESVATLGVESTSYEDVVVRDLGPVATMSGRFVMVKRSEGSLRELRFRFLAVWSRHGSSWLLEHWQNTKIPAP